VCDWTVRRQHQLPSSALSFAGIPVIQVNSVQDLGIHISLHWLRVPQCIQYKVAVLTYKILHCRMADVAARRSLRFASTSRLVIPSSSVTSIL